MDTSPFHIYYRARELAGYVHGEQKLLAAFASSDMKVYPYQIATALFALRSPYLKGVVLADEGSLGKTFEALLIATQRWYEGKNRQLLILPANLIKQWQDKLESGFPLPYVLVDTEQAFQVYAEQRNPFDQEGLVISTYDFAAMKVSCIEAITWDLVIFDEASYLSKSYTGESKTTTLLKQATEGAFRLLLTPTPITISIMDIYGLLHFIDETMLPDEKSFYARYFRKPENYGELSSWVSQYCFRTLKIQVSDYVNFSNRIPYTVGYELTNSEKLLYEAVDRYLNLPQKAAYPKMERYDLTLMYYHTVSSSAQALRRTLGGAINRLEHGAEKELLEEIVVRCQDVEVSGKMKALLEVLKKTFAKFVQLKIAKKAVIFTDNRITQKRLRDLLVEKGHGGVLVYSGQNSRDYSIMERFRHDNEVSILIATDEAAKGLDMEFCPLVINYDLLYNAIELEQRITRCHRQGQGSDVLVVNLLGRDNFSDVRIMELINKRVLQFDGIFGLSDSLLGNFDTPIEEVLNSLRRREVIEEAFRKNLRTHKPENKELVQHTENLLFTSFTQEIARKVTLTPQYIEDKIEEIQTKLWEVVRWYFEDCNQLYKERLFHLDEQSKTITFCDAEEELPILFYYWTGTRNRPYRCLKQYGMASDFKPHHGRITLAGVLGRTILDEVNCEPYGTLTVKGKIEPCTIALYGITVESKEERKNHIEVTPYYTFLGQTKSGQLLSDEQCRKVMELPVLNYQEEKENEYIRKNYNSRIFTDLRETRGYELDTLVCVDEPIQRRIQERDSVLMERIGVLKHKTAIAKTALERDTEAIKTAIKSAEKELTEITDRIYKIQMDKKLKALRHELQKKQDALFLDRMRLDLQLEKEIDEFTQMEQFTAKVLRHYLVEVTGRRK